MSIALALGFGASSLDVTGLFEFAAGLVAFFFIIVGVLIFIFVYDNLRRQKRASSATTT
ncbi:MAG: hypothetical protein OK457_02550 [Thaumarchaeota archaeon]|nr:hypothetical protein [Nitrososphaerota archaeon]